jgi:PadR family transcriptional regulator AphA
MSSDGLNPLSYVVLVLVGRGGAAPHDLVRMARRGQRIHWSGAASKMYAEPKRLERLGYLRSEKQPGRTRERTHYSLTETGVAALREWVALPTAFPRIQNEAAVRMLASEFADDAAVVVESLRPLRDEIAEQWELLEEAERRAPTLPHRERQLVLVQSLGKRLLRALLEWIDEVEREFAPNGSAGTRESGRDPDAPSASEREVSRAGRRDPNPRPTA